jgi:hypothetical protein
MSGQCSPPHSIVHSAIINSSCRLWRTFSCRGVDDLGKAGNELVHRATSAMIPILGIQIDPAPQLLSSTDSAICDSPEGVCAWSSPDSGEPARLLGLKTTVSKMPDGEWQFQCPECGVSHVEFQCLAVDDEIHCVVCWEERRVTVRLERWIDAPDQARLRGALAA